MITWGLSSVFVKRSTYISCFCHFIFSFFKKGQPRNLFVYFRSFQTQILQKKTVSFSGIQTRIVRVEGEHADHLTTTTAHDLLLLLAFIYRYSFQYFEQKIDFVTGMKPRVALPNRMRHLIRIKILNNAFTQSCVHKLHSLK